MRRFHFIKTISGHRELYPNGKLHFRNKKSAENFIANGNPCLLYETGEDEGSMTIYARGYITEPKVYVEPGEPWRPFRHYVPFELEVCMQDKSKGIPWSEVRSVIGYRNPRTWGGVHRISREEFETLSNKLDERIALEISIDGWAETAVTSAETTGVELVTPSPKRTPKRVRFLDIRVPIPAVDTGTGRTKIDVDAMISRCESIVLDDSTIKNQRETALEALRSLYLYKAAGAEIVPIETSRDETEEVIPPSVCKSWFWGIQRGSIRSKSLP